MSNIELQYVFELIKLKNEKPEEYAKLLIDIESVMCDMMLVVQKASEKAIK